MYRARAQPSKPGKPAEERIGYCVSRAICHSPWSVISVVGARDCLQGTSRSIHEANTVGGNGSMADPPCSGGDDATHPIRSHNDVSTSGVGELNLKVRIDQC